MMPSIAFLVGIVMGVLLDELILRWLASLPLDPDA